MVGNLRAGRVGGGEEFGFRPELVRGRSRVAVFGGEVLALDRVAWVRGVVSWVVLPGTRGDVVDSSPSGHVIGISSFKFQDGSLEREGRPELEENDVSHRSRPRRPRKTPRPSSCRPFRRLRRGRVLA